MVRLHEMIYVSFDDWFLDEESDRASATPPSRLTPPSEQSPPSPSSGNETQTEHESENEYDVRFSFQTSSTYRLFSSSEIDEFNGESTNLNTESETSPRLAATESIPVINDPPTTSDEREDQSIQIIIKFLNDTRKEISANLNDTILKVKEYVRYSFVWNILIVVVFFVLLDWILLKN